MRLLLAIGLLLVLTGSAAAAPSCRNCLPTIVGQNADGTVTVSTAATSRWPELNVVVAGSIGSSSVPTDGGPTTVSVTVSCPCRAAFIEHAGQWHLYSRWSEVFP